MPGFEKFGDDERREVQDVLNNGVLMRYGFDGMRNGHWKVNALEELIRERFGSPYAHCVSSGTAAVWSALVCAGVGAGHEVIVPPFTFVADVEAVLFAGAEPVYGEIDETLGLDPEKLEAAFTPRTKAVLLVHMCGSMARVDRIAAICERHGVLLIEDVAQAIGGHLGGTPLGRFGRFGCFSFDFVKTVTSGEGGALIMETREDYEMVDAFTDHGHDHKGADRGADRHPVMGLNFRLSELHAAVGLAQVRKLDTFIAHQKKLKAIFIEVLSGVEGLTFRHIPDPDGDTATFLSFFLPDEATARAGAKALAEGGVDGCPYWYSNNWHYYKSWSHFHELKSPHPLPFHQLEEKMSFQTAIMPQSDAVMARCISMLIKLSWTEEKARHRAGRMKSILSSLG